MTIEQARARVQRARREVERRTAAWKAHHDGCAVGCDDEDYCPDGADMRDLTYEAIGRRKEAEAVYREVRRG